VDEEGLLADEEIKSIREIVEAQDHTLTYSIIHTICTAVAKAQLLACNIQSQKEMAEIIDTAIKIVDKRMGNGEYEVEVDGERCRGLGGDMGLVWHQIKSELEALKKKVLGEG